MPSSAVVRARAASTASAVPHVGGDAEAADLLGGRGRGLGIPLPDGHLGPEGGQAAGDAATDAGTAAGHHGHPVGEQDGGGVHGHGYLDPYRFGVGSSLSRRGTTGSLRSRGSVCHGSNRFPWTSWPTSRVGSSRKAWPTAPTPPRSPCRSSPTGRPRSSRPTWPAAPGARRASSEAGSSSSSGSAAPSWASASPACSPASTTRSPTRTWPA